ncbi:MAG: hypothetical protein ABW033_06280, partial [Acidimicrobiia bacterium]
GLAVAKGFVDVMGGELTVEDTPGGGTTMVVRFPAYVGDQHFDDQHFDDQPFDDQPFDDQPFDDQQVIG